MSDILLWLAAAVLLALSGLFSGLNIGLMMARPDDLKRKARQGDKIAARVYRYRKDGYYLIFCILLGNVGVNTAMSILLGNMTNGVVGGLIATLLITMFGEILPQAIFSQRGYRFVRYFFWLLDVIYVLFWPLAQPMSKLLNRWLGKERRNYILIRSWRRLFTSTPSGRIVRLIMTKAELRQERCSLVKRRLAIWLHR